MKISIERSGGYSGMKLKGSLDSSTLPLSKARRLEQLIKSSGFFDLPLNQEAGTGQADRYSYKVTVETETLTRTIEAGEEAMPASMRPLLEFLTSSVRPRRQ